MRGANPRQAQILLFGSLRFDAKRGRKNVMENKVKVP